MTSVKRKIVAIVSAALMAGTMAIGASAYTTYYPSNSIQGDWVGNPPTASTSSYGTYGKMAAYNNRTSMMATTYGSNHGYSSNYKKAKFYVYKWNGSGHTEITTSRRLNEDFTATVTTSTTGITPSATWSRRVQIGWIYTSSSPDSTAQEFHYSRVTASNYA